ncbi:MAG TPA: hypothetical protein VGS00_06940 [Thermoanaerobaculia bacterium]|nr:hypothetical protein [Thermoanaerobaculia bacterium]
MKISAEQAQYVLDTLLKQGRVRWTQIQKVLRGRLEEIRSLRERLTSLEKLVGRAAPAVRRGRVRKVARRKMSSKTLALRRLQGKYMGHVRNLKASEKARVRAVREKRGIGPAIKLAASLGSK